MNGKQRTDNFCSKEHIPRDIVIAYLLIHFLNELVNKIYNKCVFFKAHHISIFSL